LASVERYDIKAERWSKLASLNTKRAGLGAACIGKDIYAVGGYEKKDNFFNSVERYDAQVLNIHPNNIH
jgi:N-acetylneuraminic acid mutarotase